MATTKLKGSQFYIHIQFGAYGYSDCSQIECALYNTADPHTVVWFEKYATKEGSNPIERLTDNDLQIDLFMSGDLTNEMKAGTYSMEIKRVLNGQKMPIIKQVTETLVLKNSAII